jgi:hypothetical protein
MRCCHSCLYVVDDILIKAFIKKLAEGEAYQNWEMKHAPMVFNEVLFFFLSYFNVLLLFKCLIVFCCFHLFLVLMAI